MNRNNFQKVYIEKHILVNCENIASVCTYSVINWDCEITMIIASYVYGICIIKKESY